MSFLRNAGSLAITSVVAIPIGFLTNVILARYLGPEEMGHYSVLQRFTTIAFVLCLLGIPSASIYRLRKTKIDARVVLSTSLSIVLCSSSVVTMILLGVGEWLSASALGSPPQLAYRVALLLIPAQATGQTMMAMSRALDRFALGNGYLLSVWIGSFVALSLGLIVFDFELVGALTLLSAVHLASTTYISVRVLAITGSRLRTSLRDVAETTRYGLKSQAQVVLTHLHENVDVLILAALLDAPDQVAFYAIATSIVNRVRILPASIANAFLPHVAGLDRGAAGELAARASRHSFVWIFSIALTAALATPIVIPLAYGERFQDVVRLILILLPATVFLSTSGLLARYFMAINHQGVVIRTQSCSTALNVALNLALIPKLGIDGAALTSLLSYAAELTLITAAFRRCSGIPVRRLFLLERGDWLDYRLRITSYWRRLNRPGSD
ncbi:MAG: oligosaccharide flippase family protein [Planctomycetes bacterium]|nr:oligosaccharide flippase family protein [Planctomycetota bacterium]